MATKIISPLDQLLAQMKQENKVAGLERKALENEIALMREREKLDNEQPVQPQMQPQMHGQEPVYTGLFGF